MFARFAQREQVPTRAGPRYGGYMLGTSGSSPNGCNRFGVKNARAEEICGQKKLYNVTQSRDEVEAWICSNAVVLLRSCRGFDKAIYQEMLAALLPLTPSPPLCTVLILPDGNEEIRRGMFEQFDEVAKTGGILESVY